MCSLHVDRCRARRRLPMFLQSQIYRGIRRPVYLTFHGDGDLLAKTVLYFLPSECGVGCHPSETVSFDVKWHWFGRGNRQILGGGIAEPLDAVCVKPVAVTGDDELLTRSPCSAREETTLVRFDKLLHFLVQLRNLLPSKWHTRHKQRDRHREGLVNVGVYYCARALETVAP